MNETSKAAKRKADNARYYSDHREELREKRRKRRAQHYADVDRIWNAICTQPCYYCGESFDTVAMTPIYKPHVRRHKGVTTHKGNIYHWAKNTSIDAVEGEAEKLVPCCANCKLIQGK